MKKIINEIKELKVEIIIMLSVILVIFYLYGQHLTRENYRLYVENYTAKTNLTTQIEELTANYTNYTVEEENALNELKTVSYRLTSYYTGDSTGSGVYVGAGLSTKKFEINDKGWYTYKGKLVLAAATYECLNTKGGACGKWNTELDYITYYNYYDELTIVIDGTEYEAIVLDSCGSCMTDEQNRIDLFVSNKDSVIDRGYKGVNEIEVYREEV